MSPTLALFTKELRQHGIFAVAMVCLCLIFLIAYIEMCRWQWYNAVSFEALLAIALFITALYSGEGTWQSLAT